MKKIRHTCLVLACALTASLFNFGGSPVFAESAVQGGTTKAGMMQSLKEEFNTSKDLQLFTDTYTYESEPNDTMDLADSLAGGLNPGYFNYISGSIADYDDYDGYKFTLATSGTVAAVGSWDNSSSFDNAYFDMAIYNSSGSMVATSTNEGSFQGVMADLPAGTYYLVVTSYEYYYNANYTVLMVANYDQLPPSGLSATSPSIVGWNDGVISGTDATMEYRKYTDSTYKPVTGSSITGLTAGTYCVRYAAKSGYNAGPDAEVVVVESTVPSPLSVLSGSNRFSTAVEISKACYDKADTVILATGWNFPDALAAGPLSIQLNAPILLTEAKSIPQATLDEIIRLNATKVIVMGSEGAIGPEVVSVLSGRGITVERVSGSNRFGTAVEAAKIVRGLSGVTDKVVLAYGWNFPDALAIGSYASKEGIPILLTSTNELNAETKAALDEFNVTDVEIVGSYSVISQNVENELTAMGINVTRSFGSNRFSTSTAIAGKYFAGSQEAIIAYGWNFPDALAAVPLAAKRNAPIILVEQNRIPADVSTYISGSQIANMTVAGGDPAVGQVVKTGLIQLMLDK